MTYLGLAEYSARYGVWTHNHCYFILFFFQSTTEAPVQEFQFTRLYLEADCLTEIQEITTAATKQSK